MKKNNVVAILICGVLFAGSCQKILHKHHEENEVKETIQVDGLVKVGGTYTYTLPANESDDPYQITVQATKYLTSDLSTDAAGNLVYTFQPVSGAVPVTNDYYQDITIANVEETHPSQTGGQCGGGSGSEHHGHERDTEVERTIHIHLTISGNGLETKSSNNISK